MNFRLSKNRGFTLIEVLIAATILFAALTVISESYRTSMQSARRAETVVRILTPLPMIISKIQASLREVPAERAEGDGAILGVTYKYAAESTKYAPPAPRFDPDQSDFVSYSPRYRLYDVKLVLALGSQQREFVYQELAWQSAARR